MTVKKQSYVFDNQPKLIPGNRLQAGEKIFDLLRCIEFKASYDGGEFKCTRAALEWSFGFLFRLFQARVIPYKLDIEEYEVRLVDNSTDLLTDSITITNGDFGCYLKLTVVNE